MKMMSQALNLEKSAEKKRKKRKKENRLGTIRRAW